MQGRKGEVDTSKREEKQPGFKYFLCSHLAMGSSTTTVVIVTIQSGVIQPNCKSRHPLHAYSERGRKKRAGGVKSRGAEAVGGAHAPTEI